MSSNTNSTRNTLPRKFKDDDVVTDKIDPAAGFRRDIKKRYNSYAWITAFAGVVCFLFLLVLDKAGFASSLTSMACALSVGLMIRNLNHKGKMLEYLARSQPDQLSQLENYLDAKHQQWQNNLWIRLIAGFVTGLAMLFLMLFHADPYWTMTLSGLFITFIVAVAILGWINFNDQLLLHDIRRSHRDQTSNIPE